MKKIACGLIGVMLIGCDSTEVAISPDTPEIKQVKEFVYDIIDPTISVGDALSNRKMCEGVKWTSFTDDQNRQFVRYYCGLKNYEQYGEKWNTVNTDKDFLIAEMVVFILTKKGIPIPATCGIVLWDKSHSTTPAESELSYNVSECTHEIYQSDYDKFHIDMLKKVHERYFFSNSPLTNTKGNSYENI